MPRKKLEPDDAKKTANGLGSIDQLPSGKWRWRVSVRVAGKRVRVAGTEVSETAAKRARNKAVTDAVRGTLVIADRVTLREYATKWLEAQPDIRESTRREYRVNLGYAFDVLGDMRLRDVRATDVQNAMKTLAVRKMQGGVQKGEGHERPHCQPSARPPALGIPAIH